MNINQFAEAEVQIGMPLPRVNEVRIRIFLPRVNEL